MWKREGNAEPAIEFSHSSCSQFLVVQMPLEKENHLLYPIPMAQFVQVLVCEWHEFYQEGICLEALSSPVLGSRCLTSAPCCGH